MKKKEFIFETLRVGTAALAASGTNILTAQVLDHLLETGVIKKENLSFSKRLAVTVGITAISAMLAARTFSFVSYKFNEVNRSFKNINKAVQERMEQERMEQENLEEEEEDDNE